MSSVPVQPYLPGQWPVFLKRLALVSLFLHVAAGYFGLGYFHADEHYQILEFVRFKLTGTTVDLPWEFAEQMRPWLQPGIVYLVAKAWTALGIEDPFVWVHSLQIGTAVVGWFLMVLVAASTPLWIQRRENQNLAVGLAFFLWFLPYLQARLSSENWCSLAFWLGVLGLSWLWNQKKLTTGPSLAAGFLFGLAFDFRFQIGFALVGVAAWCLLERLPLKRLSEVFAGILLGVGLGLMADRWGYGEWVFSPWRYLQSNVIDDKLSTFGVLPWWGYFPRIYLEATPPIGILLIGGTLASWAYAPRSLLTLSTLFFVLVHFGIGHKETRFFFPIVPVLPILLAVAWEGVQSTLHFSRLPRFVRGLFILVAVLNTLLWVGASFIPARTEIPYEKKIWRSDVRKIHYVFMHPWDVGLKMHFFRPPGMQLVQMKGWEDLAMLPYARTETLWVHADGLDIPPQLPASGAQCERRFSSMGDWARDTFRPLWIKSKARVLTLYQCHFPQP